MSFRLTSYPSPTLAIPPRRTAASKESKKGRFGRLLRRFPVTFVVSAPYLGFVLPLAAINNNPDVWFIARLVGIACVGTLIADVVWRLPRGDHWLESLREACSFSGIWTVTKVVVGVGVISQLAFTATGAGTLSNQLSSAAQRGQLSNLVSLFSTWPVIGVALVLCCLIGRAVSSSRAFATLTLLLAVGAFSAISSQRLMPFVQFAVPVLLMMLILGVGKGGRIVVIVAASFALLPSVFELRNALRRQAGVVVDEGVSAFERLRLDQQIAMVRTANVPVDIGQPGIVDLLRFGLVPRLVDPGRGSMNTGALINQWLGGSEASAYSFLAIGTIYFFYAAIGLVALYAMVGSILCLALRRAASTGPVPLVVAMLTIAIPLNWVVTFPDVLASYLQALVAFVPIALVLTIMRAKGRHQFPYTERTR